MPDAKPLSLSRHEERERTRLQPQPTKQPSMLPSDTEMEVNKWYFVASDAQTERGYYTGRFTYPDTTQTHMQYSKTKPTVPYEILRVQRPVGTPMTSADMFKELTKEGGAYGPGTPENIAYVERMAPAWKEMEFWYGQGYPQYFGKYPSFEVPSGVKIGGITEMPGGYLEIAFESTIPKQPQIQYRPRTEQQYRALLGIDEAEPFDYKAETWTEPKPQYKYVPTYYPRTQEQMKAFLGVENFETEMPGIEQTSMTGDELALQSRLIGIQEKLGAGEELDIYDYTFISKQYPDVAKEWAGQMSTQQQLEAINEKLMGGQELNIFEAILVSKHEPKVATQLADISTFNTRIATINEKLATGQDLDLLENIMVAKYAPDIAKTLATPKGVAGGYTADLPSLASSTTPSPEYYEANLQASRQFYAGLGYPELGGKYAPFTIPKGAKVSGITQTAAGLQITFEALPTTNILTAKPWEGRTPTPLELKRSETKEFGQDIGNVKSLIGPGKYGTLTGWMLGRSQEAAQMEQLIPFGPQTSKGLTVTAGFVASGEGLVNPYTPFQLSPSFIGGYIAGSGVIGYGVGKVMQPILKPFKEIIQGKASGYLTSKYQAALEAGKLEWKGVPEKIVSKITGATPKGLAPGITEFPTLIESTKATVEPSLAELPGARGFKVASDIGMETYKQLPSLFASEDIFGFTAAPKMAGYGLTVAAPIQTATKAGATLPLLKLDALAFSSITAKWFQPSPKEQVPKEPLSWSKEPQTFREGYQLQLGFQKTTGQLPSVNQLLNQVTMQEAKATPVSSPMKNIFMPNLGQTTVTKTITTPITIAALSDMTSWLMKQETQAKVTQKSTITPVTRLLQYQQMQPQTQETTELLGVSLNQPYLLTKQPQTQQDIFIPQMRSLFQLPTQTQQGKQTPILSLPPLQQQGKGIFETGTLLPETKIKTPSMPTLNISPKQSGLLNLKVTPIPEVIVTPKTEVALGLKPKLGEKQKVETSLVPQTPSATAKFFGVPKGFAPLHEFKKDWPSAGKKGEPSMSYLFGRQKRQYPVMTGSEAFKVMFGTGKEKRRKRK